MATGVLDNKLKVELMRRLLFTFWAALLILQPSLAALPSVSEIEETIKESKDLPKDKKFNIGLRENEVVISTFVSTSVDKDCKIEALLLGKTIINKYADVHRLVVSFYSTAGAKSYKQVAVTRPEILAFAAGQVTTEQLLAAIAIEEKVDTASTKTEMDSDKNKDDKADKGKDSSTQGKGGVTNNEQDKSKDKQKDEKAKTIALASGHPEAVWSPYRSSGLAFQYPAGWRISREMEGDTLVCFRRGSGDDTDTHTKIELRLYRKSKKLPVLEEARVHAQRHQRYSDFQILKPSIIVSFGVGKAFKGVSEYFTYKDSDKKTRYERHVYFGWPGYVFKLYYSCFKPDNAHINAVFEHLLSTLRVESTPTAQSRR